jgi:type II secretion system protein H
MRRGHTLIEMLVVLAVAGILAGMFAPGIGSLADRVAVEHQAARLLSAYRTAWLTARLRQRLALLRVSADTLSIRSVPGAGSPDTTLEWIAAGPAAAGVALTSPPHTTVFGPDGVAMGLSNTRHLLTRGGASRAVVVSRLGRVRMGN